MPAAQPLSARAPFPVCDWSWLHLSALFAKSNSIQVADRTGPARALPVNSDDSVIGSRATERRQDKVACSSAWLETNGRGSLRTSAQSGVFWHSLRRKPTPQTACVSAVLHATPTANFFDAKCRGASLESTVVFPFAEAPTASAHSVCHSPTDIVCLCCIQLTQIDNPH